MKKTIHLAMAALLSIACSQGPVRYTQDSPEIDTVKKLIANYNSKNYDTSFFADSSETRYNTRDNPMSPSETMAYHRETDAAYSSRGFLDEDQEFEMVVTDDGETWVNCWLDWKGTVAASGKEIVIPIHLTYRFVDGKIVREVGMWDPTEVVLEMQMIEAKNNMSADEKAMDKHFDVFVNEFINGKDLTALEKAVTADFARYMNGIKVATGPKEMGEGFRDTYMKAFPNLKVTIRNRTYNGNKAFVHWNFKGTNTGEFNGSEPTGKTVSITGLSELKFSPDGKIQEEHLFYNELALMNQLGYALGPTEE
ncbi:ester cyclase [Muricauda sp. SCSIO 64092]|uniref:nuclear transport factor 2 family protein n=1 Tax=Allomuricauda sp. SCSIO 64092 TaxID=2908842 RepID=UPI001FF51A78|nr:nuclear transport factor 2 family protein [Muricauda sp. SCSIO 64092]UOY07118.1 ester cyclase [Muricauda sp. SCSIO 64092]